MALSISHYIESQSRILSKLSNNIDNFLHPSLIPSLFLFLEGNFFRFFSSEERSNNFLYEDFGNYIINNDKYFELKQSFFETKYYNNLKNYFEVLDCPYKLNSNNFLICFQWLTQRALSYKLKDKLTQLKDKESNIQTSADSDSMTESFENNFSITQSENDILGSEYTDELNELGKIVKVTRNSNESNFNYLRRIRIMIQILSKVNTVTSTNSTEQIDTLKTLPLNFDIPESLQIPVRFLRLIHLLDQRQLNDSLNDKLLLALKASEDSQLSKMKSK